MKPSVVICCILLASASLPARAAPPVYRELRDWVVACDNTRRCEAVGFPEQHGQPLVMRLAREAGPKGELSIRLAGSGPLELNELRLDGRPLKLDAKGWQRQGEAGDFVEWTSRHDAAASQLLGAVRNGTALTAGTGPEPATGSLSGLTAALLLVDEVQGRLGTVTALVRRGDRPADTVPAADVLPKLSVAPAPPGLSERDASALPAAVRRQHAKLLEGEDCSTPQDGAHDEAHPLSPTEALVLLECWRGAYQSSSMVFAAARKPPYASRRLVLPTLALDAKQPATVDHVTSGDFDPKSGTLSHFAKGRGLADCGEAANWVFDGRQFRLASYDHLGRCGGVAPGDWLPLWRTEPR